MSTKIKELICDTNLWYRVHSQGEVPPAGFELISTYGNIFDFIGSSRMDTEAGISELAQTTRSCISNSQLYPESFIQELLTVQFGTLSLTSDYLATQQLGRDLLEALANSEKPNDDKILQMQELVKAFKSIKQGAYKNTQIIKDELVSYLSSKGLVNAKGAVTWSEDVERAIQGAIRRYLCDQMNMFSKNHCLNPYEIVLSKSPKPNLNKFQVNWQDFPWHKVMVFLKTYARYIFALISIQGKKIRENDYVDIFNLIYLHRAYAYSTEDKMIGKHFRQENLTCTIHVPKN